MKSINERCPLSEECGKKKCEHVRQELECGYYLANSRPGYEIVDQELLRPQVSDEAFIDASVGDSNRLVYIPIERLIPHPDNPRKDLGDLTELSASIKENGIFQNLTVVADDPTVANPTFTVIIGHRRLAAAKLAGLTEVPCVVVEMTPKEQLQTMLLENMQRSDLTVYEQAQGFQMMLDLGATLEEIAEKSGFSKTTVRRRLDMAKLDQKTLQQVSARQLSLTDFDRLTEIEDMKLRNAVLKEIGTQNFEESLEKAKKKEAIAKKMPQVKAYLKEHNAKPLKDRDTWGSKYTSSFGKNGRYFYYIWLHTFGEKKGDPLQKKEDYGDNQLYYVLDESRISFYIEAPRANTGRGKQSEEEKTRNRTMREVRAKIKEFSQLHYELRKKFIDGLSVTKQNREKVISGALAPAIYFASSGGAHHSKTISDVTGLREWEYKSDVILKATADLQEKDYAKIVYAIYNDSAENWFASNMDTPATVPCYRADSCNVLLQLLYRWLISLGYEPSDDEQALMDGSHEIYSKEKKK